MAAADPNFGPLTVTVDLPNYAIATWAGDIGSAAAIKALDEATGDPADWSTYLGPQGTRASWADLDGDVDGLVIGTGGTHGSCEPQANPESPILPRISETLEAYEQGSLAALRSGRIACLARLLGVGYLERPDLRRRGVVRKVLDVEELVRRYQAGVTQFARFYVARQGVRGLALFVARNRVAELSLEATRMFGSWLRKPVVGALPSRVAATGAR